MLGPGKRVFRLPWRTPVSDVEAELRFHLEARIAELVGQGRSEVEARAEAASEFGDRDVVRAELIRIDRRIAQRHSRRDRIELLALPFRFAFRRLLRRPGFFALTAGSLALALGATTAAIGFADAWTHPTISFDAPERTAGLTMWGGPDYKRGPLKAIDRWHRIAETQSFEGYALTGIEASTVRIGEEVARESVLKVSANFAAITGVHLRRGRSFIAGTVDEDAVLVSTLYWRRYFGDRELLGDASIEVGGRTYRVIGVMPRSPMWPLGVNVFRLMTLAETQQLAWPIVRLKRGTTIERAQQQLNATAAIMNAGGDPARPYGFTLHPFVDQSSKGLNGIHFIMLLVAGFVLVIACANVSALLLARASSRRRDLALRLSLGASRGAIVADVLAELAILAAVGASLGLVIANGATGIVRALMPQEIAWASYVEMHWSWRVFAISGVVLGLVIIAVGLLPALQVSRIPLMEPLKESTGGAVARRPQRMKSVVMLQLAASLVMLIATGVFVASAARLARFDFGIDTRRVLSVTGNYVYQWNTARLGGRPPTEFVLPRVAAAKGVVVASFYAGAKPEGLQVTADGFTRSGLPLLVDQYTIAGPRFLETVGVTLLEGRDFSEGDSAGTGAVILDDSAAKALFPAGSAVGRRVRLGRATSNEPWRRVVGVARSVALRFPSASIPARSPAIYVAQTLPTTREFAVVARVARVEDALMATQQIRREVTSILPLSVQLSVRPLSARHDASLRSQRQLATLFGSLSIGALLFAAAGLFAVLSYMVSQRMREFGVRVAVGASRRDVARLVLRDALELALGGTAIGGTAGLVLTSLFGGALFGIRDTSVWGLVTAEAILIAVAAIAALGPVLRAMRADPVDVLRAS